MILVVGATGLLGGEICRLLDTAGKPFRALVRATSDKGKVAQLQSLGAEIVRGDLRDRSSLDAACKDVDAVISTASATISRQEGDSIQTVDLDGQLSLIEAAKGAGVSQFILVSFSPSAIEFPLQAAKRAVEEQLKRSGLEFTILQPTCFMEVWLSPALGFDAANAKAQIYGLGENKISWISYRDVAKFAADSLDNPAARNAVIELGGPECLSPFEVVRIFEQVQGRAFEIQHVPDESLLEQKKTASDPLQQSFAGLMLYYSAGAVIDMRETLQEFPVQLISVKDYAQTNQEEPMVANEAGGKPNKDYIEQYKSYMQDVGNIGVRHENSRRFYLSVLSALFVFLSMAGEKGPLEFVQGMVLKLVVLAGISLCIVWGVSMQAFGALYKAKFDVLRMIETKYHLFPVFDEEWKLLQANPRYKFLTWLDTLTPILFVALFIAMLSLK
jgi:uncharacterized protein YbjT (DUF2867 family)